MSERSEAYDELGGSQPSELTLAEKLALYRMNLGSRAMRLEVEAILGAQKDTDREQKDTDQHAINLAGAEECRNERLKIDLAKGVDIGSRDYLVKQRLEERRRTRRS